MLSGNEAETAWTSPQKPASIMGQPPYIIIFYYLEIYSTPPPSSSSYIFTISIVCLLNYLLYAQQIFFNYLNTAIILTSTPLCYSSKETFANKDEPGLCQFQYIRVDINIFFFPGNIYLHTVQYQAVHCFLYVHCTVQYTSLFCHLSQFFFSIIHAC